MSAPVPELPGAVGISRLAVYPWQSVDGLHGGSPHVHTACTECYVVVGGRGELHTLTADGPQERELHPGDVVWFTPGTVHRAVNTGDLDVVVVMQNSGLPEAGDAVMTFPPEHLVSPEAYAAAASLAGPDGSPSPDRARARRDLAVEGYARILRRTCDGDGSALAEFHAAAAALVRHRVAEFRRRVEEGAAAAARATDEQLNALAAGDAAHLRRATVTGLSRRERPVLGMCGFLSPYLPADAPSFTPGS
ncbi:cupin domain-containing protein [Kineococcus sp. SYSU DK004]|uniref:cupin domain-containing protein n=1 Tax=Kineococcus sp. SYSU DK004 TaxID=3383125 RepID=UPI003D7C555E